MYPIDLRSDTLTQPTQAMRDAMHGATVGDDGRTDITGRGGDPSINQLEDYTASLLGKEAALFCATGTMGNVVALMTHCRRGDKVAVEPNLHVVRSEKAPFMDNFFGLIKVLYDCQRLGIADADAFEDVCSQKGVRLACIENSHNYGGGVCSSVAHMQDLYRRAQRHGVPVHLDGARLLNAALYLGVEPRLLSDCADTVMLCLSKGLGAPFGSLLCGPKDFIQHARENRKYLGGGLRQGGIMATAGLIALKDGATHLSQDHALAKKLGQGLSQFSCCTVIPVETNIVLLDIRQTGKTSHWFETVLALLGLLVKGMGDNYLRFTTYRGVSEDDIHKTITIFSDLIAQEKLN